MVGPTLFALFPMACVCLWSVWKLIAELRMSDDRILRKARECFGDNFQQLYYGQFNGINSFKSEKRLCQMLSRFSNNRREIVDRLFKRSGLHKPHWEKAMVAVPNGPSLAYKDFVLRISIDPKPPSALYFYLLDIIQNLAGTFGFAGTVLSLMATMGSMSVDMSQAEMINVLLQKSSAAFGSTAVGIFISVPAYIASKIFRRFFPQESDNKPGIEEQMLLDALVAQKFSTQQHMTQKEIIND
ncbi:MAG: MotA/TolQ/ExbB proton channel family protein [Thermodesulfobacteriota bacterium]